MTSNYKRSYQIDRVSKKYLPVLIIFMSYVPIVNAINYGKLTQIYSYVIYGLLAVFSVGYFWVHRGAFVKKYSWMSALCMFMALYVVAACIKLCFVPSSIFFYQRLVCFCSFLSIGLVFQFMREGIIQRILKMWWRFVPWITLLSYPFVEKPQVLHMLFLVFFFVMLADCLRKQLRFLTYGIVAFLSMFCIYQRMDYLFILLPICVFFFIRNNLFMTFQKSMLLYSILMCIPVVFLFIALWGNFNVLEFDSYIKGEYTSASGEDMTADTRTFLYEESIASATKNKYVLFGRTPGYGYDSEFVASSENAYNKVKGVCPQRNSEVFVVNIFTWCGVLGLLVWFLWFYWFGISVLKKAKNKYLKGLVFYVGFFWICDWIGNSFTSINYSNILLFIIMSICVQPHFQKMTDDEIQNYFRKMLH